MRTYIRYSHYPGQVQRSYDRTKPGIYRVRAKSARQATALVAKRVQAKDGGVGIVSARNTQRR